MARHPRRTTQAAALALAVLASVLLPALPASAWTTADDRISTSRMAADKTYQVFTVRPDGSAPVQLTFGGRDKCDPAMSKDGTQVAFSHGTRISVVGTSGSGVEQEVARVPDDEYVRTPAWSPDGRTVVFLRSFGYASGTAPTHSTRIYAATRTEDGTWSPAVPFGPDTDSAAPRFSPDGASVVLSVGPTGGERDLHVMDVTSKVLTRVTSMPGSETMASWHPTTPGLLLFTTCSRGVYTVQVGSSAPPAKVGTLSACDVTWDSRTGSRIVVHSGTQLSVYDQATGRSTVVDRRTTDRQPDW